MALSDILKKYGDSTATEGIMFPSAGVQSTSTEQQVYDSTTDGIMTVTGQQYSLPTYTGPTATVQYGGEEAGYPRMLREIEQGELPQFRQEDFPKAGEGRTEESTPTTQPITTTPFEPTTPDIDPCPPGFKYDPVQKMCVPVEQPQDSGRSSSENINVPRNIGSTSQALGQLTKVLQKQGITQDGSYDDDVNYTIDNSTALSKIGGIGILLDSIFIKGPADKKLESLGGSTEGIIVTKNKDNTRNVLVTNNEGKVNVGRLLTAESLSGNLATTQKRDGLGNIMRAPNGQLMIEGPVEINPYGKELYPGIITKGEAAQQVDRLNQEEKNKLISELDDMIPARQTLGVTATRATGPTLNFDEVINEYLKPIGQGVPFQSAISETVTPTGKDIRAVDSALGTTSPLAFENKFEGSRAASGADAQRSLMTDSRRTSRVSEPAGQQPDFLGQQQTLEREERKKKEKEQKAKIGYGQNIDQNIINANKKDSDREAQKQTGDSTMRAVTDRYGNPIRTTSGKVVTNPAPKSGGGGGGGSSKIVCTMMNESYGFGSFRNKIWLAYGSKLSKEYEIGYHTLFLPLVKYAKQKGFTNIIIKNVLEHIAIHRTVDIRKQKYNKVDVLGRAYRLILEPLCYITGRIKLWKKK